jgi:PTH1 family peptidyl-tRNA hydrolase
VPALSEPIKLIVGLGNPGDKYRGTRHNAGADFVESLAHDYGVNLQPDAKFFGLAGRLQSAGMDIRLLIPTTYMNRSGQAVSAMAKFFKIACANILVAHDELDFAPGDARFKIGGGHGGHNGLRDIISAMGPDFVRLRIGIGHPGSASEVTNYVLKTASQSDRRLIADSLERSADTLPLLAAGELAKATQQLHSSN